MPRFAILTHDWPTLHWDLFLEYGTTAKDVQTTSKSGQARTLILATARVVEPESGGK